MFDSISFIGAGRVAHIMLGGWRKAGALPTNILAYDTNLDAVTSLQSSFPNVKSASLAEAARADLVFGALHPPMMVSVLGEISNHLSAHAVFCSLAPVIKLATLREKLGGLSRLARLNPNAPSIVGSGYNPISFDPGLPEDVRAGLLALLKPLGSCPQVDDAMIENYAVVSAMGPTYFWFQFEELRRLAESWGLTPQTARDAMASMLHGAVETMFESDLPPERVLDLVPVRPMAGDENNIRAMMQMRIGAIHAKLHPSS